MLVSVSVSVFVFVSVSVPSHTFPITKPNCDDCCGNVTIPYPFGTSPECHRAPSFAVTLLHPIARSCYNSSSVVSASTQPLTLPPQLTVNDTANKLTIVWCDTIAFIYGKRLDRSFMTGCTAMCDAVADLEDVQTFNIDECANNDLNVCMQKASCTNTIGNYTCSCPKGYSGNGRGPNGCIGISCGITTLLIAAIFFYMELKRRSSKAEKHRFFLNNGGFLLQQKLSARERSPNAVKIFPSSELHAATAAFSPHREGVVDDEKVGLLFDEEGLVNVVDCNGGGNGMICDEFDSSWGRFVNEVDGGR
ncbi:hypothetical protein SASPL_150291 [Salvia splendens]|uniref:EGF-like domain-containing protein n=1 Tax=Salvia splendens TaxID=180675 RepID=A0A8X8W6B0_SALSN|nr:hypothetical protein SASPL_150291 [Salvia splendens]